MYRFILLDLDDPTISIRRFVSTLQDLIEDKEISIDVFGCSENNSEQMRNKCEQHNVCFLHKPLTRETCIDFAERYPPAENNRSLM